MTKYSLIFKILTLAALTVVLVMSLQPSVGVGGPKHFDKVMHLGAYGVLAGLCRLGWPKVWGGILFLLLACFGIIIELSQHFMALGRTGSIADTLANMLGAALALMVFHFLWTRHKH